jgi:hypothetical protein
MYFITSPAEATTEARFPTVWYIGRTTLCLCAFSVSLPEDSIIRGRQITLDSKIARVSFTSLP